MKLICLSCFLLALFELGTAISDGINPYYVRNGDPVSNLEDFPFVSQLQFYQTYLCACSAISETYILTAGHCVRSSPSYYRVLAGKLVLNEGHQFSAVSDVYLHPSYNSYYLQYDVAVLRLYHGLRFTSRVQKVTLGYNYPPQENSIVWTAGWAENHLRDGYRPVYGYRLRFVKMRILSSNECLRLLNTIYYYSSPIPSRIFCALNDDVSRNEAQGDYGGPLMLLNSNVQVGIMSWGYVQVPGYQTLPATYTNLGDREIYEFVRHYVYY